MLRFFLPGAFISMTSLLCPNLKQSAEAVPFRPPGWVFGIVWPVLYITTGYAWYLSKLDYFFSVVIALCCAWLIVYSCKKSKVNAAYVLAASAVTSWSIVYQLYGNNAMIYMLPLACWLTFATTINLYEVNAT